MREVHIIYGTAIGKTSAAVGCGIKAASQGKTVTIVQFLKGADSDYDILKRLEPEIRIFTFETGDKAFVDLSMEERDEQRIKVQTSFNYAKKVIETGGSDVIILDELLGLLDYNMIFVQDVINLIQDNPDIHIIITGRNLAKELLSVATKVSLLVPEK